MKNGCEKGWYFGFIGGLICVYLWIFCSNILGLFCSIGYVMVF